MAELGLPEFALYPARNAAGDQIGDFAQQSWNILRFHQHSAVRLPVRRVVIRGDQCRRRLVVHHLRVRKNLQSGFGRFHLQIAQNQLVFLIFHLADCFGGSGRRIHTIPAGLQNRLQG